MKRPIADIIGIEGEFDVQARVLIIEDVKEMADLIRLYLQKEGMDSTICETGEDGLAAFGRNRFDLVVLDINLPGMDGFEFLQRLRKMSAVPVMIVSARDADEDMILGLGIGADEFVTKPFSPKVLVARVRAMLRRATDMKASANSVKFGDYVLDIDGYLLKRGGEKVPLSSKEFEVLSFLATHPGKAMTPGDHLLRGLEEPVRRHHRGRRLHPEAPQEDREGPLLPGLHRDGSRHGLPLQPGGGARMKLRTQFFFLVGGSSRCRSS